MPQVLFAGEGRARRSCWHRSRAFRSLERLGGIFPQRVVRLVEEEGRIAGIFGINVDFACGDRLAHHGRGAKLDAIRGLDAVCVENGQNDVAENAAFRVDLGRDDHLCMRDAGKLDCACKEGKCDGTSLE